MHDNYKSILEKRIALCMRQLTRGGRVSEEANIIYRQMLATERELKLIQLKQAKN